MQGVKNDSNSYIEWILGEDDLHRGEVRRCEDGAEGHFNGRVRMGGDSLWESAESWPCLMPTGESWKWPNGSVPIEDNPYPKVKVRRLSGTALAVPSFVDSAGGLFTRRN